MKTTAEIKKRKVFVLDIEKVEKYRLIHKMQKQDIAKALGVYPNVITYVYQATPAKWAPAIADLWGMDGKDFIKIIEVEIN